MDKHDWFTKKSRSSKFMSFINKKIKHYCNIKYSTKDQIRIYIKKVNQWIDDDKSIYLREDLTFNLIRSTNLGVTKADELRKNLWILNNQSIRRERKTIAITMKIFIMESTMRQYKIDVLPIL